MIFPWPPHIQCSHFVIIPLTCIISFLILFIIFERISALIIELYWRSFEVRVLMCPFSLHTTWHVFLPDGWYSNVYYWKYWRGYQQSWEFKRFICRANHHKWVCLKTRFNLDRKMSGTKYRTLLPICLL